MPSEVSSDAVVRLSGVTRSLWQAVATFRAVAFVFCAYLVLRWHRLYAHVTVAIAVVAIMGVVTAGLLWTVLRARTVRPSWVLADLVVTVLLTLATRWAQTADQLGGGLHSMPTLTTVWAAGPVIEAAFVWRWAGGVLAALAQFGAAVGTRHGYDGRTVSSGVLLVITGALTGQLAMLVVRAERQLAEATAARAAVAERERLARSIHDGVLQVLALVHRTGRDAERPWGPIAAAAAEQEAALRGLITSGGASGTSSAGGAGGTVELGERLRALRSARVTVATPADPVPAPIAYADELVAAVRAALHNVELHAGAGARAWVLLEREPDMVRVTVRDDGCGMPSTRPQQAASDGRLGIAASIRGRVVGLGGSVTITSALGDGTVLELSVPAPAVSR